MVTSAFSSRQDKPEINNSLDFTLMMMLNGDGRITKHPVLVNSSNRAIPNDWTQCAEYNQMGMQIMLLFQLVTEDHPEKCNVQGLSRIQSSSVKYLQYPG